MFWFSFLIQEFCHGVMVNKLVFQDPLFLNSEFGPLWMSHTFDLAQKSKLYFVGGEV